MIEAFRSSLTVARAGDHITPPKESTLHGIACDLAGMADAYIDDSATFHSRGDRVNALAAVAYAAGWRDFAISLGLIRGSPLPLSFGRSVTSATDREERFLEKASRYARLLSIAYNSIRPAPETGTIPGQAAEQYRLVAQVFLNEGNFCIQAGATASGLFLCSYGHAWLDAGVRAGLFRVISSRELFTI